MAKKKHSTALFEVITKSRQQPKSAYARTGGVLAAARGWFKRRTVLSVPAPAATEPIAAPAAAKPVVMAPLVDAAAVKALAPIVEYAGALAPSQEMIDAAVGTPAETEAAVYSDLLTTPRAQSVAVAVDPERRQISLRLSYSAAIIGAFATLVVVGLAIIVGKHMSHSSVPLLAQTSSKKLREGEAHREVLDPPRRPTAGGIIGGADAASGGNHASPPPPADHPTDNRPAPPSPAGDGKRYIGLNYFIIQGYPEEERKMAIDAAEFLNKEGISCTVETQVKGFMHITVVGLQGFDRPSLKEMKAYEQRILQASAKFAAGNHSFKAFKPVAKKWDKVD